MSFEVRRAERKQAKLKLGVSGPSGSGKTYSALLMARGIASSWEKITLIDTENGSGELYAHLGAYNVIPFGPPFDPRRYVEAIEAAVKGGAEVVVIDSVSHEWDGKGGCLDIQTQMGGKYQDWARVTPMHNAFIQSILQSPVHIITCTRKKQDYALETNERGKPAPKKVGMKEIQRDGFEYELTINFDIEINHFATASKDRTGLFMPRGPFKIESATGTELVKWAEGGAVVVPAEEKKPGAESKTSTASLREPGPKPSVDPRPSSIPTPTSASPKKENPASGNGSTAEVKATPSDTAKEEQAISEPQGKRLWAIAMDQGWNAEDLKSMLSMEFGENSIKLIPIHKYRGVISRIQKGPRA